MSENNGPAYVFRLDVTDGGTVQLPTPASLGYEARRIWVIDFVSLVATAGVAGGDFYLAIQDDAGNEYFTAAKTVDANTTETLFIEFTRGLPYFGAMTTAGSGYRSPRDASDRTPNFVTNLAGATGGILHIGCHTEYPAVRTG